MHGSAHYCSVCDHGRTHRTIFQLELGCSHYQSILEGRKDEETRLVVLSTRTQFRHATILPIGRETSKSMDF